MTPSTFNSGISSQVASKCEELKNSEESFTTELFKMCPKQYLFKRNKRLNDPISIMIYVAIFTSVVGVIAPGVGSEALLEVQTIASHTKEQDRLLNDLEDKVQRNHEAIGNLALHFNAAIDNIQAHQNDYAEFKGKYSNSTFAIAYITARLMLTKTMMQQATRQWKLGRGDPAFLDFFNVSLSCGDRCPIDLARPHKCSSTPTGNKVLVEFAAQEISDNLVLVEADPFVFMFKRKLKH
ncbi:unnamed protein product, partial [Allacma fusca]